MARVKLSPPWIIYVSKVKAIFEKDPDVKIEFKEDERKLNIYVTGKEKYEAISELFPMVKIFGNESLEINIIPANAGNKSKMDVFRKAFNGNPIVKEFFSDELFGFNFIIFERKVVQLYNDRMDDPHGIYSTLYQEIAKDLFDDHDGIYFSTEMGDDVIM